MVIISMGTDRVEFNVPDELMKVPHGYMGNSCSEMEILWERYFLPAVVALIRNRDGNGCDL